MIFLIGGLASGTGAYAATLDVDDAKIAHTEEWELPDDDVALEALADAMSRRYEVIIGAEIGCGLVPVAREERARRECVGRFHCLLAERAQTVVRLYCGIPQVLKGELP